MSDCVFCQIVSGETAAFLVHQSPGTIAFLDTRPVFKGHVLVVPREHHETLADLPTEQLSPFFDIVQHISARMLPALQAQGTFIAMNNVVSQSVPHLHCHIVPRTKGDGLRGFFWPRTKYADGEAAEYAQRLGAALDHR